MLTPVMLVAGQDGVRDVVDVLAQLPGTLVVGHRFDGQVVVRTVSWPGSSSDAALEIAYGCVSCTIRDDLLVLLRRLHRRRDVSRIVVALPPWLEPEPICWAIRNVHVRVGPGYIDGPAARDVVIAGVVTCVDATRWRHQATGDDDLPDGRTVAQVVVGQAEFADVLVLSEPDPATLAVLRRLAPRARKTVGTARVELALGHLEPDSPRGQGIGPYNPLLTGQPPLDADGQITLVEFSARRPFHPQRLHAAMEKLLDGVVRTRGRAWLSTRVDDVMWIESAGGGLRFSNAGKWVAAMEPPERCHLAPERLALAGLHWDPMFGDRQVSMVILVCGANPAEITDALGGALLTDDELSRPDDWRHAGDPFGDWHEEPCQHATLQAVDATTEPDRGRNH